MNTIQGGRPPEGRDDPGHRDGLDVVRVVILLAGGAIGAILAITLLSAWKDASTPANAAITTIGTIVGAAIGVLALEGRRRR